MDTSRITISLGIELQQYCNNQGCNSMTFFGRDIQLDAPVFVKVIDKEKISQNYFREAHILYDCKHDNIMEIRCAGEVDNKIIFVMDICNEGSLHDVIENKFLTCRDIIRLSLGFLNGLHHVHTKSFIHFDIKPSNIMLKNGRAILSDFGLTKQANVYGFAIPEGIYNSHIPPEAFRAQELSSLADIYQSGVTLYRLCNGNYEYRRQVSMCSNNLHTNIVNGTIPDRKHYLPHIPKSLRRIITKAMNVDPNKRYQTVLDFQNALSSIIESFPLDWQLEIIQNEYIWKRKTSTHEIVFKTIFFGNTFNSEGTKINILTGNVRKISSCFGAFPTHQWHDYCYSQLENIK